MQRADLLNGSAKLTKVAAVTALALCLTAQVGCAQSQTDTAGVGSADQATATAPAASSAADESAVADEASEAGESAASDQVITTPYYTVTIPEGLIEEDWSYEYDDAMADYGEQKAGHTTYVYTASSGDEPYITILQCSENWVGLQHDEGEYSTATAFTSEDDEGNVMWTVVKGGAYGDYGSLTLEESTALTQSWADCVSEVSE